MTRLNQENIQARNGRRAVGGIAVVAALLMACGGAPQGASESRGWTVGGSQAPTNGVGAAATHGGVAAAGPGAKAGVPGAPGATATGIASMGALPSGPGLMGVPNFDGQSSEQVFSQTLYPILRQRCAKCHSEPPEGRNQMPLHASADVKTAHMWALTKINLRQVVNSKLIERQSMEGHNCWGDCKQNGEEIRVAAQTWADSMKAALPVSTQKIHQGDITEAEVLQWIMADKAKNPADPQFIKYASLHRIFNAHDASPDDMNTARVGLSKILNSTSYSQKLVNPVAIDEYNIVYRFDIRDYWGTGRGGRPGDAAGNWARALKGNYNADDQTAGPNTFANKDTPTNSMAKMTPTFPNIAGFYPDYVDAAQLGYTLSRPDVYADVMSLGTLSPGLEASLGVKQQGIDTWKFITVDDAITINKRMLLRTDTPEGYFWKGVDPFGQSPFIFYDRPIPEMDGFSLVKTTPVFAADGSYRMDNGLSVDANGNLTGGPQAQASEMIFSLPNGLQGYFVGGAANQIRVDAFGFIVFDPRRGGPSPSGFRIGPGSELRLVTPASCMSCHLDGMNRVVDDMITYVDANPTKFDAATVARVRALYPDTETIRAQIEKDRTIYAKAMDTIRTPMMVGMEDKTIYREPIEYLFLSAQKIFTYTPTASN